MEIRVPDEFVVRKCETCGADHAPIRECDGHISGMGDFSDDEYDREADYWKWSDRL